VPASAASRSVHGVNRAGGANTTTATYVGKRTAFSLPSAPALGPAFIAGGDLYNSTGTTTVGTAYSSCTVVGVSVAVSPDITHSRMADPPPV
jgi:hypothetical protein